MNELDRTNEQQSINYVMVIYLDTQIKNRLLRQSIEMYLGDCNLPCN